MYVDGSITITNEVHINVEDPSNPDFGVDDLTTKKYVFRRIIFYAYKEWTYASRFQRQNRKVIFNKTK